jgi:aminomethyltransferase
MTSVASASGPLMQSPLHARHVDAGARMVPFAGWSMPIQYEGVIAEHQAVRTQVGLFDVSHMGQLIITGAHAEAALNAVLSNDLARIPEPGMAQYTLLTNDEGGIEDDLIAYRRADGSFLLVVNAAHTAHDAAWLARRLPHDVEVRDVSASWAMIAVQGPTSLDVVADVLKVDLRDLRPFRFIETDISGHLAFACTTGYSGERGCELLVAPQVATAVWDSLVADDRVTQCGLAARDTLRLEACYPLHGNDITPRTSAVGAGLAWACAFDTSFPGRDILASERASGSDSVLVAVRVTGRGIPRRGCPVLDVAGNVVGEVSSGTMSPTLRTGIALAWCEQGVSEPGTMLGIDVRGTSYPATVQPRPFYRPSVTT